MKNRFLFGGLVALLVSLADAGTFRGRPLRRVEGASVFASGTAGFRFCLTTAPARC